MSPDNDFDADITANRLIHDVYVWMVANDELVLKPFDLTALQYRALELIDELDRPNLMTLSDAMITSKSTVTRIIDYLEHSGWARRESDRSDRRNFRLHLTEEGQAHLQQARSAFQSSLHERFATLTAQAQQGLIHALSALREHFLTVLANPTDS